MSAASQWNYISDCDMPSDTMSLTCLLSPRNPYKSHCRSSEHQLQIIVSHGQSTEAGGNLQTKREKPKDD